MVAMFTLPPGASEVLRYTDKLIDETKPANRALVIEAVSMVLRTSMDQWRMTEDPRFLELVLRATDRLVKLGRLAEPDAPLIIDQQDPAVLVAKVRADLAELEARVSESLG